jgi:mediator of RNA polymerase II transcription subunit 18
LYSIHPSHPIEAHNPPPTIATDPGSLKPLIEPNSNMHELFLSTQVANEDLQRALRILQGYCGMKPVTVFRRRLIWEGPRTRNLKGIDPTFIQRQPSLKEPSWRTLHDQLVRQSYVVTLIYDVDRNQFGRTENIVGLDSEGGTASEEL